MSAFQAEATNFGTLDLQNCSCFAFQEWFDSKNGSRRLRFKKTNTNTLRILRQRLTTLFNCESALLVLGAIYDSGSHSPLQKDAPANTLRACGAPGGTRCGTCVSHSQSPKPSNCPKPWKPKDFGPVPRCEGCRSGRREALSPVRQWPWQVGRVGKGGAGERAKRKERKGRKEGKKGLRLPRGFRGLRGFGFRGLST